MEPSLRALGSYLFGALSILANLTLWWVGGNAIRAGTLTGGVTLLGVGLLFLFAGTVALPISRRRVQARFDIELSAPATVLLSGGAVVVGVLVLIAAFIALLASG